MPVSATCPPVSAANFADRGQCPSILLLIADTCRSVTPPDIFMTSDLGGASSLASPCTRRGSDAGSAQSHSVQRSERSCSGIVIMHRYADPIWVDPRYRLILRLAWRLRDARRCSGSRIMHRDATRGRGIFALNKKRFNSQRQLIFCVTAARGVCTLQNYE